MQIVSTNITIADYCSAMARGDIIVNRDYQRSDKVWPVAAKSYLIESIILGYPIPKLFLYPKIDLKSKKTIKEIVDGQQRSQAIYDYYCDNTRISFKSKFDDLRGKSYSELEDTQQNLFLTYPLSIDLLTSASPDEVRESFRRINSYTVPLNPEEIRHAVYQGDFKWFISELSSKYDDMFINLGVFTNKQIIRMVDLKLLSELVYAYQNGIANSDERKLNNLYELYDGEYPDKTLFESRIDHALDFVLCLDDIHNSPLMKPYNMYSLILAISHVHTPIELFNTSFESRGEYKFELDQVKYNLSLLSEALEDKAGTKGRFSEFVLANMSKTNGALHRKIRFKWFCRALQPESL